MFKEIYALRHKVKIFFINKYSLKWEFLVLDLMLLIFSFFILT